MSNHVHLIAIPGKVDVMGRALKDTHGRYAAYWNAFHRSSGHVWQGRFYSCPLDESHLWKALRYTELNPVRAGLVAKAERWEWSSAAAHCGVPQWSCGKLVGPLAGGGHFLPRGKPNLS
jgi:putative transposase